MLGKDDAEAGEKRGETIHQWRGKERDRTKGLTDDFCVKEGIALNQAAGAKKVDLTRNVCVK